MSQGRAPGVEHGDQTQPRAQALGIGGDGPQGLGGGLEQQIIDHGLVVEGDGGDLSWQGEDDMEIGRGQQIGLTLGQPNLGRRTLTLGAMAVAAGVVAHRQALAVVAARDMTAQLGGATGLNGRHGLELTKAQVSGMVTAIGRPMGAEDVGHLQGWPGHGD